MFLNTDSFYLDTKRVHYVIIAERKVSSHDNSVEYVGAVARRWFYKVGVLKNFAKSTEKHQCQSLFFNRVVSRRPQTCNFIKKETPSQVVSSEFCAILKNTLITEQLWTATSG